MFMQEDYDWNAHYHFQFRSNVVVQQLFNYSVITEVKHRNGLRVTCSVVFSTQGGEAVQLSYNPKIEETTVSGKKSIYYWRTVTMHTSSLSQKLLPCTGVSVSHRCESCWEKVCFSNYSMNWTDDTESSVLPPSLLWSWPWWVWGGEVWPCAVRCARLPRCAHRGVSHKQPDSERDLCAAVRAAAVWTDKTRCLQELLEV